MSFGRLALGLLGLGSFLAAFWIEEPLLQVALHVMGVVAWYSVFYLKQDWGFYAAAYVVGGVAVGLFTLGTQPLIVFAGWEGVSVAAWLLIAARAGWSGRGLIAAQISFLVNRLGDAFWIGALLSGGWNWGFVIGGWVKAAMFPTTFWLIQAMWGAAPTSALLHSALLVALGVYGPIKYGGWLGGLPMEAISQAAEVSALGCAVGGILSRSPKAALAWTTAAHLSLAAAHWVRPELAAQALFSHAYHKAALFLLLGAIQKRFGWALGEQLLWLGIGAALLLSSPQQPMSLGYGAELVSAFVVGRILRAYPLVRGGLGFLSGFSGILAGLGLYRHALYFDFWHLGLIGALGFGAFWRWPYVRYRLDKVPLRLTSLLMAGWLRLSAFLAFYERQSLRWQDRGLKAVLRGAHYLACWEKGAIDRVWRPFMSRGMTALSRLVYGVKESSHYQTMLKWSLLVSLLFLGLWRYFS